MHMILALQPERAREATHHRPRHRTPSRTRAYAMFAAEGIRAVEELLGSPATMQGVLVALARLDAPRYRPPRTPRMRLVWSSTRHARRSSPAPPVPNLRKACWHSEFSPNDRSKRCRLVAESFSCSTPFRIPATSGRFFERPRRSARARRSRCPVLLTYGTRKSSVQRWDALFRHHAFAASLDRASRLSRSRVDPVVDRRRVAETLIGGNSSGPIRSRSPRQRGKRRDAPSSRRCAERRVAIAAPGMESLNVAVATGILLFALA